MVKYFLSKYASTCQVPTVALNVLQTLMINRDGEGAGSKVVPVRFHRQDARWNFT